MQHVNCKLFHPNIKYLEHALRTLLFHDLFQFKPTTPDKIFDNGG